MELVNEYNRRFSNKIDTETTNLFDLYKIISESPVEENSLANSDNNRLPEEDTTDDWDFAVSVQLNLDNGGQHAQSNKEEEEDDPEFAQAIRESKKTSRVIQQARSVSAEYPCYCDDCIHDSAQNQCRCIICKLKRTVQIWRRRRRNN